MSDVAGGIDEVEEGGVAYADRTFKGEEDVKVWISVLV